MYTQSTRGILIRVKPEYRADHSEPDQRRFVWAYTVEIENHGEVTVQLLSRHWIIINAIGVTQEVKGEGVVGEHPVLAPGQAFEYTSGTPLDTPSGLMRGSYLMRTMDGERFEVAVPAFSLDSPEEPARRRPH